MGRKPCCDKIGLKQGPWTPEEDKKLINFILGHEYQCCWRDVPKHAGLLRCGKSCRLRWTNYLRPDLKRGLLSEHEEKLVIDLHSQLGNKWSKIASHMPGRTDNEIKNLWHTQIKKKLSKMGIDPLTHKPLSSDLHQNHDDQSLEEVEEIIEEMKEQDKAQENDGILLLEESTITATDDHLAKEKISMDTDNGFSIDEVPLMETDEILIPHCDLPSSTSLSSSSATPSTISVPSTINLILEDLKFAPCFEDWTSDGITLLEESRITNIDDHPDNKNTVYVGNDNGFSKDEVPLTEPHEVLVPNPNSCSSTTSASSTTICMSSINSIPEDLKFLPSFEDWHSDYDHSENMCFLNNDDFTDWDWLVNELDFTEINHDMIQSPRDLTFDIGLH